MTTEQIEGFKQALKTSFDKYTSSKLYLDAIKSFGLQNIKWEIINEQNKHGLIEFYVNTFLNQPFDKRSFPALQFSKEEARLLHQPMIDQAAINENAAIAFDEGRNIIGCIIFRDFVAHQTKTKTNTITPVKLQHDSEMFQFALNEALKKWKIDPNEIKYGDYLHPGWASISGDYAKTGLLPILSSFVLYFQFALGYKNVISTASTSATRFNTKSNIIKTADYNMNKYVFNDGTKMETYIHKYAQKHGISSQCSHEWNKLQNSSVIQVQMLKSPFSNYKMVHSAIKFTFLHFKKKHSKL